MNITSDMFNTLLLHNINNKCSK